MNAPVGSIIPVKPFFYIYFLKMCSPATDVMKFFFILVFSVILAMQSMHSISNVKKMTM